jgi:hypothetical protein
MRPIMRRFMAFTVLISMATLGCKKTAIPEELKAIPDGAMAVVSLNLKNLLEAYTREILPMLPAQIRSQIPDHQAAFKTFEQLSGIDVGKVTSVMLFFMAPRPGVAGPEGALVAGGIDVATLKGQKFADHQGTPLYKLTIEEGRADQPFYAPLGQNLVAFSISEDMLKRVLDAQQGAAKRLLDGEASAVLKDLAAHEAALADLRIYALRLDLPGLTDRLPVKPTAGGFFVDLKKGIAFVTHLSPADAGTLETLLTSGLSMIKLEFAKVTADQVPPELKQLDLQKLKGLLEAVQITKTGTGVEVSLKGDNAGVFVAGTLAAVAIPAFVRYIRLSKTSEVHVNLDGCLKGALMYYDQPHARPDGTTVESVLPPGMAEPICPGDKTVQTLDGKAALFKPELFSPAGKGAAFSAIKFTPEDPCYACYQLTSEAAGKAPKDGQTVACHAWTNVDNDDKPAHWTKTATFDAASSSFKAGPVERDPASGEW